MLKRLWRLLDRRDRRRVLWILPLLLVTAFVEVAGVAAVVPFLALLADPASVYTLPVVGPAFAASGATDPAILLRWTGLVLATVLLLANALVIVTFWWLYRFSWSLNHRLSSRLLGHYLSQPYAFILTRNTAALANKVVVEVRHLVESGFQSGLEILTRTVVIAAIVGFLFALDPVLAITVFAVLGLLFGAIFAASRRYLQRVGAEAVVMGGARLKALNEALGGFKDLKVTGREAFAHLQYDRPSRRFGEIQAAQSAIVRLPRYALEAVAVGGMVVIASLLSGRDDALTTTLPLLGAYAFAGLRLMPAMQQLFTAIARIRFATGSLDAVEADFQAADAGEGAMKSLPAPLPFEHAIVLRDVRFRYPEGDEPVLDGVTLEIPRQRSIALVGRTGSGKTTLVDVMLGLLTPDAGTVEVDEVPVSVEQRRSYRRLFGYVPQSVYLLDDTVTRNIALGLPDEEIDMESVRRACALAQIADFVEHELPNGYQTIVGERGVRLSGGQRQRIGIARALYHRPPVLVFDEATSALDVHTERQLFGALEAIARSHTVVTIAHRLETVAKSDVVVVLDRGRVVDRGSPEEVLKRYRLADVAGPATAVGSAGPA